MNTENKDPLIANLNMDSGHIEGIINAFKGLDPSIAKSICNSAIVMTATIAFAIIVCFSIAVFIK